jgi:uncharacterized RDD family membrane protein YckC
MREEENPGTVKGASFWVRATAHLVDVALVTSVMCVLALPLAMRMVLTGTTEIPVWMRWLEIPFDLCFLFGVVVLWKKTQTTPGKKLFGLQIVDARTGGSPGWKQLFLRYFGYLVGFLPILPFRLLGRLVPDLGRLGAPNAGLMEGWEGWVFGIPLCWGFLWILVDRRRRGWHDLMSGTLTVLAPRGPAGEVDQ